MQKKLKLAVTCFILFKNWLNSILECRISVTTYCSSSYCMLYDEVDISIIDCHR